MSPEEMRLPELEQTAFTSNLLLRREWVMDPPPWILNRLGDDLIINIYRMKVEGLARIYELESKKLALEAELFTEMANMLG